MANKEFQVRHGLVVNNSVLVANTITNNVGIGRSDPGYALDVVGTVNASAVLVNGSQISANLTPAFDQANNANITAIGAFNKANDAYSTAQSAFTKANTAGLANGSNLTVQFNFNGQFKGSNTFTFDEGNFGLVVKATDNIDANKSSMLGDYIRQQTSNTDPAAAYGCTEMSISATRMERADRYDQTSGYYSLIDLQALYGELFIQKYQDISDLTTGNTGLYWSYGFEFKDGSLANSVTIKRDTAQATSYTLYLPTSGPNEGDALIANANGYLSFSQVAANLTPAFDQANNANITAIAAFDQANAAPGIANSYATAVGTSGNTFASSVGVGANAYATAVGTSGNAYALTTATAIGTAGNTYATAVGTAGNTYAASVGVGANSYATSVGTSGNAYALSTATSIGTSGNSYATAVGTSSNAYATDVGTAGNAFATLIGASANGWANTKVSSSGGTITGDLNIVGNLFITGNSQFQNVTTLSIGDPLIYLAANNYLSDTVDIGFIANYVNATGANVHTGLYREHLDKMYYLFQGYDQEPINNHIGALSNNMTLAVLNADLRTSNLTLFGANAQQFIISAFAAANAAPGIANSYATAVGTSANAYTTSVGTSGNAYALATATSIGTSGNSYATEVGTAGNAYTVSVGTSANAYATAVGTAGNTYAASVGVGANTYALAAFNQANNANITAIAAFNKANTSTSGGGGAYSGDNGEASGTGLGDIFRVHKNTLSANVTIYSGNNSVAVGPLTIASGKTLTIQANARSVIV